MLRTVLMTLSLLIAWPCVASEAPVRTDTTLEFTVERQGAKPALIVTGTVAEITDKQVPAKATLTRDTTYVSSRYTEGDTITLVPNTVREGSEVELTNTTATRATVNVALEMLRGISNIAGGVGSVATTQRHQVVLDVEAGEQQQNVRIDGKNYRITTVYTPGDSVLASTTKSPKEGKVISATKDEQVNPAKVNTDQEDTRKERLDPLRKQTEKSKKESKDTTDEYGHP